MADTLARCSQCALGAQRNHRTGDSFRHWWRGCLWDEPVGTAKDDLFDAAKSFGVSEDEVQYQRKMIRDLEKKEETEDPAELLCVLIHESEDRICGHFSQCFSDVSFCQYEEIVNRIDASRYGDAHKLAMKELTARLRKKQSVDAVLDELEQEDYEIARILERFTNLGISPIPLWKSFCAASIPGPVELLNRVSQENVQVDYEKVKYR